MQAQGVHIPRSLVFLTQEDTAKFHATLSLVAISSGHEGHVVQLQEPAAEAFLAARQTLESDHGLNLTLGRHKSALRSFNDTLEIWNRNQFDAKCSGRDCIETACSLPHNDFVRRIRATALPGTSQHHIGIAIDIDQWQNHVVVSTLARYGFHRTVYRDRPHFTYLGVTSPESLGLQWADGYWIPKTAQVE